MFSEDSVCHYVHVEHMPLWTETPSRIQTPYRTEIPLGREHEIYA